MIKVVRVRDVLRRPSQEEAAELHVFVPGATVRFYLPSDFDSEAGNLVLLNDVALTGEQVDTAPVPDGSTITAGDIPGIGVPIAFAIGGALATAATAETAAALTTLGMIVAGAIDFVVVGGLSIALSYGISMLTAGKPPRMGKDEEGPNRSFDGIQDTVGNGIPIPFAYGEVRCGGHFLASFERPTSGEQVEEGITTLHTLLGIGIGPVEGISEIQINGNDLADLPDIETEIRLGDADQAPIPGFDEVIHEVVHDAFIQQKDGPQTYTTTDEVDSIEIIFRFPNGLYRASSTGALRNADVAFGVQYRALGSEVQTPASKTVSAKVRSPFKSLLKLENLPRARYEVIITRTTIDDDDRPAGETLRYITISQVYAFNEIKNESKTHPGLAMVAFKQIPSEQLNGAAPQNYTLLLKAQNEIRVYSDPNTYVTQWSENNAWCCAHFLTHPLIGLAESYDDIDIDAWLAWAAYCDELVPDGKGGLEPRCTIGHIFDQYESADRILEVFTRSSGATLLRQGTKWTVVLDREDSMVWVGHEGNTERGAVVSYLTVEERANRLRVTFADKENDYQRDSHSMEWEDLQQGDVYVDSSLEMFGITRRTQAAREATRALLHNKFDLTRIELISGLDSLRVQPGSIFGWSCYTTGVGIASGRILAVDADKTVLTLDTEVTLESGKSYEIVVQHQSNSAISVMRIGNEAGKHLQVSTLTSDWAGVPAAGDLYALGEYTLSVEKYRCVSASLGEDFRRRIVGLRYDPQVYTFDLGAEASIVPSSIPDPRKLPPDVVDLVLHERQEYGQDGALSEVIDVDWAAPVSAVLDRYEVWVREEDGSAWTLAGTTRSTHFEIYGLESPDVAYRVAVVSVSSLGIKKSPGNSPQYVILTTGVVDQPPMLTGLSVTIIDGTLVATVAPLSPSVLGPGGYYEWRLGSTWAKSVLLDRTPGPRLEMKSYPRGTVSILVKAYNSVGNCSPDAISFQLTLYGQIEENIVLSGSEAPTWGGTMTGLAEDGSHRLSFYKPIRSVVWRTPSGSKQRRGARFMSFGYPDPEAIEATEAYYTTAPITVSSGQTVLARADALVSFEPINIELGTFADATWAFDSEQANVPFSGDEPDKVRVVIESRISTTDTQDGSWSSWAEHRNRGEMTMKYIQFRLHVIVESDAYDILIAGFNYSIDLPDKIVSGVSTAGSANPVTVNYPSNYFIAVKRLLCTLIGGANGDYFKVTSQGASSFTWEARNSSHNLITGTIHYEARGY